MSNKRRIRKVNRRIDSLETNITWVIRIIGVGFSLLAAQLFYVIHQLHLHTHP